MKGLKTSGPQRQESVPDWVWRVFPNLERRGLDAVHGFRRGHTGEQIAEQLFRCNGLSLCVVRVFAASQCGLAPKGRIIGFFPKTLPRTP